jgi:apolipoprotein N-acyltransferase
VIRLSPGRRSAGLVGVGAVALALSYPPFRFPALSFLAAAPAVLLVRGCEDERSPRAALRWGFWYGFVSQAVVLYWLVVALWHFTAVSALGYLATIAVYGLWYALLFWLVVRVRLRLPRLPLWAVFPLAWTAVEWAMGHQGDIRFPWLGLGTSLADAPVLIQWADLAGARGVTLWVAWVSAMTVDVLLEGRGAWGRGGLGRIGAVLGTALVALGYGAWRMRSLPVREVGVVGLVQPNEGFREKWDPRHADSVVAKLVAMSRSLAARGQIDLLLWPEAAIPGWLTEQPNWDAQIADLARGMRTAVLAGGIYATNFRDRSDDYYNAAFFYDTTGTWRNAPVYGKHYLVPVVERVPFFPVRLFRSIPGLGRWSGGFARGHALPVYRTAAGGFGVLICYESAFEDLGRRYRRAGAEFLVNITNDAWFGRTAGPYQHASHLVLRAIETRMGIARAANSGISGTVDPLGRYHDVTGLDVETAVAATLWTSDVTTPYVRLGDWVGTLSVLATLGFAGVVVVDKWRSRRPL